jgi:membrane protein DedA with SNARE-associated domain
MSAEVRVQEVLREYLTAHGYWVLFLWTFLEGEAGLIFAGFLAFQGYFTLSGVIVTASCGAFLGDQFYFYLGRRKGKLLLQISHRFSRKFTKGLKLIEKYGTFVAFISRYTYGFRIVLPIILGMTPFPSVSFFWLNIASALSWAILFTIVGYMFGQSAALFVEDVSRYEHYLILILAGFIFLAWASHFVIAWWRRKPARERLRRLRHYKKERLGQ